MRLLIVKDLASLAYKDILRRRKTAPFLIFISFILFFAISRLTVRTFPDFAIIIRQYHIHHFYYGIFLISVAAWIALVSNRQRLMSIAAVMFGAGLGLITDEIGLLLTCNSEGLNCDYYARESFDIAVYIGLFFLAAIYFPPFWLKVKKRAAKVMSRVRG